MLDMRRTDQVLCGLGVQPPDVPRLCVAPASIVQKAGLHVLQGARGVPFCSPRGLLTDACKEQQLTVVFTLSPDAPFSSYTPESIPYKDEKLAISFETQEMMQESLFLLRYNCPDPSCDHRMAMGWNDLKLHVRDAHKKQMWCAPTCLLVCHQQSESTTKAACASPTRKFSRMNTRFTRSPNTSRIFHRRNADNKRVCRKIRLRVVSILSASSAAIASLATMNYTPTCDFRTKSASSASKTGSGINSKPSSLHTPRH